MHTVSGRLVKHTGKYEIREHYQHVGPLFTGRWRKRFSVYYKPTGENLGERSSLSLAYSLRNRDINQRFGGKRTVKRSKK